MATEYSSANNVSGVSIQLFTSHQYYIASSSSSSSPVDDAERLPVDDAERNDCSFVPLLLTHAENPILEAKALLMRLSNFLRKQNNGGPTGRAAGCSWGTKKNKKGRCGARRLVTDKSRRLGLNDRFVFSTTFYTVSRLNSIAVATPP